MARDPKLTQEMVDEAIRLKADSLSNGDIVCALGIHESTFYRWIGEPKTKLQRELSEGLKRKDRRSSGRCSRLSARRRWRATSTGWRPRGCSSANTPDEFGKAERQRDDAKADAAPKIVLGVVASQCSRRCRWTGSARATRMVDASSLVIPRFHDVLGDVLAHGHTHYWLHGGRGSTKSSFISVCIVLLLLLHPEANAVVVRRFSNTLRGGLGLVPRPVALRALRLGARRAQAHDL